MSEIVAAALGVLGTLLAVITSYTLGQRAERKKQSLVTRSEMLKPIEEWLKGVERLVAILGDTISTAGVDLRNPTRYNQDERRRASTIMGENTNLVIGILDSKSLQTRQTKKLAAELEISILTLEQALKYQLQDMEKEIIEKLNSAALTREDTLRAGELKLKIDAELQTAHMLIAKIKTSLS